MYGTGRVRYSIVYLSISASEVFAKTILDYYKGI